MSTDRDVRITIIRMILSSVATKKLDAMTLVLAARNRSSKNAMANKS